MKYKEKDFKVENYEEFYADHHFTPLKEEDSFNAHRFIPRVAWALDVAKEVQAKKVLDLGCLDGFASLTIAKHVPSVEFVKGIDLSKDGIEHATLRAQSLETPATSYTQGTIEDFLEKTDMKFDFIMLFEVIEHVKSPRALLKLIDRVKTDNATILISTPDFEAPTFGKDDEQNKCHIRLYTTADENYRAVNKYGNEREATSITKEIGKDRIIDMGVYSELINVRYQ